MSKNGNNNKNSNNDQDPKVEHPKATLSRLRKEILEECRLISTGQKESCYTLVEKTREMMRIEEVLEPKKDSKDSSDNDDE